MKKIVLLLVLLSFTVWKASSQSTKSWIKTFEGSQTPYKATLADAKWLRGTWQSIPGNFHAEHVILEEKKGQMPGLVRSVDSNGIRFYEITSFVEENASITYKVKHFSSNLKGWEAQNESINRKLVTINNNHLFFDGITFRKISTDQFRVYFLIRDGDRRGEIIEIDFNRMKCYED